MIGLLDTFRVYQTRSCFVRWHERATKLRELSRRDSLIGAQLQLDNFKKQLQMFDLAMEKLYAEKASKQDLEVLRRDTSAEAQRSVFDDMKVLFDVTVKGLKNEMSHVSEQTDINFDVIEAKFRELARGVKKDHDRHLDRRLDTLEAAVERVVLEQGQLNAKVGPSFGQLIKDKDDLSTYEAFQAAGKPPAEVTRRDVETLNQKIVKNMLCLESFEQR